VEFQGYLGYRKDIGYARRAEYGEINESRFIRNIRLPTSVDWRTKGVVSAVKNQGGCGSCWAFASAETLESAYAIKTGNLELLSEQQICSCTSNPQDCGGTGGCEGGTPEVAYASAIKVNGLASEQTYPYVSGNGQDFPCKFDPTKTPPVATISAYTVLPSNKQQPILEALVDNGPLAIAVWASPWMSYSSGVFKGCSYSGNMDIDHAVQLVGYGTDPSGGDYWIVRNSWGGTWGEQGYIRLFRDNANSPPCGKDNSPQDGVGCSGGPSVVTVCGQCGILYDVVYPTP